MIQSLDWNNYSYVYNININNVCVLIRDIEIKVVVI